MNSKWRGRIANGAMGVMLRFRPQWETLVTNGIIALQSCRLCCSSRRCSFMQGLRMQSAWQEKIKQKIAAAGACHGGAIHIPT